MPQAQISIYVESLSRAKKHLAFMNIQHSTSVLLVHGTLVCMDYTRWSDGNLGTAAYGAIRDLRKRMVYVCFVRLHQRQIFVNPPQRQILFIRGTRNALLKLNPQALEEGMIDGFDTHRQTVQNCRGM